MSTLYLMSLFTDQISDVLSSEGTDPAPITGNYVIRIPDTIAVRSPTDLSDILTQKYTNLLASNGLFTQIVYDDMLDASHINGTTSSAVTLGARGENSVYNGGQLVSQASSFSWTGSGAGPTQAYMTWEVFQYVDSDPINGLYTRSYLEVASSASPFHVEISFNGGTAWQTATDGSLVTVAVPNQGTSLLVRFTHTGTPSGRFFLGSWSVLF